MKKIIFVICILSFPTFMYGQFGGCGNRINSVVFTPIIGTNDIDLSINSQCCQVHNLNNYNYTNNSPNHIIDLCYRDSGLLLPTNITSNIILTNINTTGNQNITLNSYYFFVQSVTQCSSNTVFNPPINLSFIAPLTAPRTFLLSENEFDIKKISLYPNPNNGIFSIDLPTNINKVALSIVDLSGKILYNLNDYSGNQIEIKNFAKGVYFAKITYEDKTEIEKFIIN